MPSRSGPSAKATVNARTLILDGISKATDNIWALSLGRLAPLVIEAPMTVFEALAILEAAVLECKKRDINTLEVWEALNLLGLYIQPGWLIPQYRMALDSDQATDLGKEGQ